MPQTGFFDFQNRLSSLEQTGDPLERLNYLIPWGPSDPRNCRPDTGLELLYQPSRFGANRNQATRSGWECARN